MNKIDLPVKRYSLYKRIKRKLKGKSAITPYFDENKCIFVHVPKVAGTSIKNTLFPNTKGPGHKLAMDYYLASPKKYSQYFVFGFVRNPYDRLVSAYNYLMQGGKGAADVSFRDTYLLEYKDFEDFVKRGLSKPEMAGWWHFMPQYLYVVDFNGNIALDFLGKFENIDEDFNQIVKKLGMDVELPHNNKSSRGGYQNYYTEETRKIAYDYYKKDFEYFSYPDTFID